MLKGTIIFGVFVAVVIAGGILLIHFFPITSTESGKPPIVEIIEKMQAPATDRVEALEKIVEKQKRQINLLIENDIRYLKLLQLFKKRVEALEGEKGAKRYNTADFSLDKP